MKKCVNIKIAETIPEIENVMNLRRDIFVKEENVPEDKEFDGNDFVGCTHFYAEDNGEVIGCVRARFASSFAKLERLCVKSEYRKTPVATQLMDFATSFCEYKGYDKIVGYCTSHLLPYWKKSGFSLCVDVPPQKVGNMELFTIVKNIAPSPSGVSLNRPETLLNNDQMMAQKNYARRRAIEILKSIQQYKQK